MKTQWFAQNALHIQGTYKIFPFIILFLQYMVDLPPHLKQIWLLCGQVAINDHDVGGIGLGIVGQW
jgi:hypothetical protein